MKTEIRSKHGVVSKAPYELYMGFADMRNFTRMVPEDKVSEYRLEADYDSVHAVVQGFNVGVKAVGREPYSRIDFADDGAPFNFNISVHFDPVDGQPGKTDFYVEVSADLNFMMKMMLSSGQWIACLKTACGMLSAMMPHRWCARLCRALHLSRCV